MECVGLIIRHAPLSPAEILNLPLTFLTLLLRRFCAEEGRPVGPSLEVRDFQKWLKNSGTDLDDTLAITNYFTRTKWTSKQS